MNLKKKKCLAARTFGVGAGRIAFTNERIEEIKEAITKQDMRDLLASGAISIKQIKGRRKAKPGSRRKGFGKRKKNVGTRKRDYMHLTRKLRRFLKQMQLQGRVSKEDYNKTRKQIKASVFRSKAHMNELIQTMLTPRGEEEKKGKIKTRKIKQENKI